MGFFTLFSILEFKLAFRLEDIRSVACLRAIYFLFLLCSLPVVGLASDSFVQFNEIQSSKNIILVMGDSISAAFGINHNKGWVSLLQNRIDSERLPYKVINASISGETTQGGATRIKQLLAQFSPDIILLELGGNDGLRGLPIKIIRQSLETIVTSIKQKNIQLVLLGMRLPPNYGIQYTQQFEDLFHELATKHKTRLVPFLMQGFASNPDMIQSDGIHPRSEAQALMLDNVWPVLKPLLQVGR